MITRLSSRYYRARPALALLPFALLLLTACTSGGGGSSSGSKY